MYGVSYSKRGTRGIRHMVSKQIVLRPHVIWRTNEYPSAEGASLGPPHQFAAMPPSGSVLADEIVLDPSISSYISVHTQRAH